MSVKTRGGSRQKELVPRSRCPIIKVDPDHPLIRMTDTVDWDELIDRVWTVREKKVKSPAGRPPHMRANVGAQVLMAVKPMTYREAEDYIRYYAPARYLCGLTETDWTLDHTTIHDFSALIGSEGMEVINEYVVEFAVEKKLANPRVAVADTTAQEAAIPHPNEMGMMSKFLSSVGRSSKKCGKALKNFRRKIKKKLKMAKRAVREYRLFAKSKDAKKKLIEEVAGVVEDVQEGLAAALEETCRFGRGLKGYSQVAFSKIVNLHETMKKLLPQIRHWLRTGKVVKGKIVSLNIPELYSIVRGKVGKAVEFGLKWGITRLKGGYLLATCAEDRLDLADTQFSVDAVKLVEEKFGKVPRSYGYDRGGFSKENVFELKELGVKEVGLAPRGKGRWPVRGKAKDKLVRERAKVEGGIGTIKCRKYGFNRPRARSIDTMRYCGQRAVLGFNLNKLVREIGMMKEKEATA